MLGGAKKPRHCMHWSGCAHERPFIRAQTVLKKLQRLASEVARSQWMTAVPTIQQVLLHAPSNDHLCHRARKRTASEDRPSPTRLRCPRARSPPHDRLDAIATSLSSRSNGSLGRLLGGDDAGAEDEAVEGNLPTVLLVKTRRWRAISQCGAGGGGSDEITHTHTHIHYMTSPQCPRSLHPPRSSAMSGPRVCAGGRCPGGNEDTVPSTEDFGIIGGERYRSRPV